MSCALYDNEKLAKKLISQVGKIDKDGKTAMMYAIDCDSQNVITMLLDYKDENIVKETTSLMYAINQ